MDGESHVWATPEVRVGGEPTLTDRSAGVALLYTTYMYTH